jgi:hypothetical protein
MFSFLLSLMMTLSPMAAGGNGHHWGWRNQAPRTVPQVNLVTPRPGLSSPGPVYGNPGSDPNPGPFRFGN